MRRLAILWLAMVLCFAGFAAPCLAQEAPPDIPLLTRQAEAGDIAAAISLGEAYLDGNGIARDLDAAIGWFATAAQANNVEGLYFLSYALRERAKPGDLDHALSYAKSALAQARSRRGYSKAFIAGIEAQLGFVYESLGHFDQAVMAQESALRVLERELGRHHPTVATAYAGLAASLIGAGKFTEALRATDIALDIFGKLGAKAPMANLYLNQGTCLLRLARYSEALAALDTSRGLFIELAGPDSLDIADVLDTMSHVYFELRRYPESLQSARQALAIHDKAKRPETEAIARLRNHLGLALQELGQIDDAREQYLAALHIYERLHGPGNSLTVHPLVNLGNVEDDRERFADAVAYYERAFGILVESLGPDHAETATMLGRIGNSLRKAGRTDAALEHFLQALLIQAAADDPDINSLRYTYRGLTQIMIARGNRSAALLFAKQAVNTHQTVRSLNSELSAGFRSSLAESFQRSYRFLMEQLLADGQFSEAQFVSGLLKQEEFYEFIRSGDRPSAGRLDAEPGSVRLTKAEQTLWTQLEGLMAPEHKIAARIRAARQKTDSPSIEKQENLNDLLSQRREAVGVFVAAARDLLARAESERISRQKEPLDIGQHHKEKLQADLKPLGRHVVLLQAISLEDGLYLFVSAAGRETVLRKVQISRPELARLVLTAVSAVENKSDDAVAKLTGLSDLLIKPVRSDLEAAVIRDGGNTPVLLLDLSGFLRYVPYAALYDGRHYLVEDFALALYNPSTPTKFTPMRRTGIKGAGFGVTRQQAGFAALPGVGRELEAVFDILDGTFALDDTFNEDSLAKALARKPQILHIASHFRFRPGNETNSYLLLGNGDGLTLDQLRTQKRFRFRGVDLLTLSACETARGGGAEGEEIESFGALAQANGAAAVMSTLWQISDSSTAQIMTGFYDGLISRNLDKADALRQAQLAMIRGGWPQAVAVNSSRSMTIVEDRASSASKDLPPNSHPYYWAAFILMGNWR